MNTKHPEPKLPAELEDRFQQVKDTSLPDDAARQRMRSQFTHQIQQLRPQNVTIPQNQRLNQQKATHMNNVFWRKQTMAIKIVSIVMALVTLFSGAGAGTVFASQDTLPDEFLYPVKLWSEELRLTLSQDIEKDLLLHLDFADERIDEMLALAETGLAPENALKINLQTHLWLAEKLADQAADPVQAQAQVRSRMMLQEQKLTGAPEDALMTQTRTMLQQQIHWMECQTDECRQQVCEDETCLNEGPLMTQDMLQIRDQLRTDQPEDAGNPDANGYTGDYPEPQQGQNEDPGTGSNGGEDQTGNGYGSPQQTPEPGNQQQNGPGKK